MGGREGEGHGLGLHVVLIYPISTRETAAAYTGLLWLGPEQQVLFIYIHVNSKIEAK